MPGDVGAVAALLNTWSKWLLDPSGYQQMSLEGKLKHLREAIDAAIEARAWDAADRLFAEYRRLSEEQPK